MVPDFGLDGRLPQGGVEGTRVFCSEFGDKVVAGGFIHLGGSFIRRGGSFVHGGGVELGEKEKGENKEWRKLICTKKLCAHKQTTKRKLVIGDGRAFRFCHWGQYGAAGDEVEAEVQCSADVADPKLFVDMSSDRDRCRKCLGFTNTTGDGNGRGVCASFREKAQVDGDCRRHR